jgi:hypothetical protein
MLLRTILYIKMVGYLVTMFVFFVFFVLFTFLSARKADLKKGFQHLVVVLVLVVVVVVVVVVVGTQVKKRF